MPAYVYKAKMLTGNVTRGFIDAPDEKSARDQVRKQKLTLLEIQEKGTSILDTLAKINPLKPSVNAKELVLFSRQLSTLVSAGVPLVQGLTILEEQVESKLFKSIVKVVREDIEAGLSISDALRKHPQAFEELY
jgi:type IV pilus assembly protein PilC